VSFVMLFYVVELRTVSHVNASAVDNVLDSNCDVSEN